MDDFLLVWVRTYQHSEAFRALVLAWDAFAGIVVWGLPLIALLWLVPWVWASRGVGVAFFEKNRVALAALLVMAWSCWLYPLGFVFWKQIVIRRPFFGDPLAVDGWSAFPMESTYCFPDHGSSFSIALAIALPIGLAHAWWLSKNLAVKRRGALFRLFVYFGSLWGLLPMVPVLGWVLTTLF